MPFLYIAIGGALGSMARYALSTWTIQSFLFARFPIGTFVVNIIGCLIAGVLAGLGEKYQLFSNDARLFIFTGIMGGFTTFSAFGLETLQLLRQHELVIAVTYVTLSVIVGIFLLAAGFYITQKI